MRVHNIQTLAALGSFELSFRMQTTQTTPFTSAITPTIDIHVNHNESVDNSIVSVKENLALSISPIPLLAPPHRF